MNVKILSIRKISWFERLYKCGDFFVLCELDGGERYEFYVWSHSLISREDLEATIRNRIEELKADKVKQMKSFEQFNNLEVEVK